MRYLNLFIILLFLGGCRLEPNVENQNGILTSKIMILDSQISKTDAKRISAHILKVSKDIKDEFNPIRYPWVNNTLVNLGFKKKGLCWHWSDELYSRLIGKIEPLKIQRVGANIGRLSEHNAVILSSIDSDINSSILIDLWRLGGNPLIMSVKDDESYLWSLREN